MKRSVIIDCFPESAGRYGKGYAVVAIDVIRATTTAITAAALGRRCFPVASLDAAFALARRINNPLLVGEQGGIVPKGFDMNNSPADLTARADFERPVILLSSSGTRLCNAISGSATAFLACLRNYASLARYLSHAFPKVAVVGAGSRNEFREEDQMCCAWLADMLLTFGYESESESTMAIVERWRHAPVEAGFGGKSATYLRRSGQIEDLDFILNHIDDLQQIFSLRTGEVFMDAVSYRDDKQLVELGDA